MYKPHEMKGDVLLRAMVEEQFADTVLLPKALDHGSYGYAQFMDDFPAENEADARQFFWRLGGVCALFRTFASTDFHCENILAQGSWPVLDGQRVDVRSYLPEFEAGFSTIYDRCVACRAVLLDELEQFAGCQLRTLLRNSNDYATLLRGMTSAKALSSQEYHTKLVQMLQTNLSQLAGETEKDAGKAIAQAEMTAMLRGDVPLFHCRTDDTGLYADGACILPDFLRETPLAYLRQRLGGMSAAEREFELQVIRQALRCAHIRCAPDLSAAHVPAKPETVSFRAEADAVFEQIWVNRVVSPSGGAGWMDHRTDENSFGYLPFLYGTGEGGIAAFAAEYAAAAQDPRAVLLHHGGAPAFDHPRLR